MRPHEEEDYDSDDDGGVSRKAVEREMEMEIEEEAGPDEAEARPIILADRLGPVHGKVDDLAELVIRGESSGLSLPDYLAKELGFETIRPGRSVLWYKTVDMKLSNWLYMMADRTAQDGAAGGYEVILAVGDDNEGEIKVSSLALLQAANSDGSMLNFKGAWSIDYADGGKPSANDDLTEDLLSGRVQKMQFGMNPYNCSTP